MSNSARAVFLDHASLDLGDLDLQPLQQAFRQLTLHAQTAPEQVAERLQGAQVAISNKVPLSAATFAACPELKLVLVTATGTNNIDLAAARAHGVPYPWQLPTTTPWARAAARAMARRRWRSIA